MIRHSEKISGDEVKSWNEMSEKIADCELSHKFTPKKALHTASTEYVLGFRYDLLNAADGLNSRSIKVLISH